MEKRLGVLISGRGSNLRAIVEATRAGHLHATVAVVVSNVATAPGLEYARAAGIETLMMPHGDWPSRTEYDGAVARALQERHVDLVCLAGFMRLLSPAFLDAFPNRVLNIHPSLLPAFPGQHAQRRALEHGVTIAGATVHLVNHELDAGPIVLQAAVEVLPTDTAETLSARILEEEHRLYPRAIQRVLDGAWTLDGRRLVHQPTRGRQP